MKDLFLDKISGLPGRVEADGEAIKKLCRLPVVLYGDGWYAPYVREYLARFGAKVAGCFADDGFTASPGTVSLAEIGRRFAEFNVVIAFADFRLARKKLEAKACGQIAGIYFFDAMAAMPGNTLDREFARRHREQFGAVYGLLADDLSRETYAAFLGAKLGGDPERLYEVWRKDQYFPEGLIRLSEREVFVDGGAYTGDTLLAFLRKTKNKYARCCAFEPEPENAAKLAALAGRQRFRDVSIINKALWSGAETLRFSGAAGATASALSAAGAAAVETDTIDRAAPDATYIKLDVEGAELEALRGAAGTIRRNRPKLAVCLYHKPEDLFEIPLYIQSLAPDYRFFLRQHQPVSCELVLYGVTGDTILNSFKKRD
ncbi:MAG TPA: hypothetical protein DEQ38_05995 [Elusimicrobia bacterium]|nr:MAG: hypothetical protein A2089_13830 [Elusimicrobia bacterium GWD2_63_28]OGR79995.1 MAG: hypothetical protein A2X38_00850 [Elusimicrobia bacterium GWC2_61_25]HCC47653.1 hypothetical protein [Elusimicrobiota bacterium]